MSMDAFRKVVATHRRPSVEQGQMFATPVDLGTVLVFGDPVTFDRDTADGIDVAVPAFELTFDPKDDIRQGDILVINSIDHVVLEVRFPSFPIPQYLAQALVKRAEVHS